MGRNKADVWVFRVEGIDSSRDVDVFSSPLVLFGEQVLIH